MLYTNELGQKAAERQALAWMMADFLGAGRQVQQIATPEPEPLPLRRDWIDPDTVLKRRPKPEPKPARVAAPIRKGPPTDDESVQILRQYAADGQSIAAASRQLGVCESTARRKAARLGIEFRKYNQPAMTDDELAEQARALFADGHGIAATANRIGCGKNRLLRIAYEYGLEGSHT